MGTIENDNKIWVVRAKNAFYLINNSFKWARLMLKKTHKSVYNNSTNLIKLHWNDDKYHWKNWTPNAGDINLSSFQVKKLMQNVRDKHTENGKKSDKERAFPFFPSRSFSFSLCVCLLFSVSNILFAFFSERASAREGRGSEWWEKMLEKSRPLALKGKL